MSGWASPARTRASTRSPRHGHPRVLRGDIEGLRAIAVLMVLLFHAGVPGLGGGFAGVDVFFVISGYLITGLLVKEADRQGRISLPTFYARRARRLLPAASLVLAVTAVLGWWVLPRGRHGELGTDVLGATGYVVNWVLARREVDYLAEDSPPSLLQHYWSLSVEEQFYVLWPLLIIALLWAARRYRLSFRRLLTGSLTALVGLSLLWSVVHTADAPGTAYLVTTTRVWQLGAGALLVLLTPVLLQLRPRVAGALAWTGLAAVGGTLVLVSTATPWPGSAALLPTLGTAAVIAAGIAAPASPAALLLGRRPMRWFGGLSYGLYLWHWPVLRLLAEVEPDAGLPLRLAAVGVSVLLAWASLHLVENPIRFHPRLSARPRPALTYGAASMLLTGALGAALLLSAPQLDEHARDKVLDAQARPTQDAATTSRPPAGAIDRTRAIDRAGAIGLVTVASRSEPELTVVPHPSQIFTPSGPVVPDPSVAIKDQPDTAYAEGCQVPAGSTRIVAEEDCWFGDPEGDRTVALVGDSKMLQWLTALEPIARQESWRLKVYTKSGCGFATIDLSPECHAYNRALSQRLGDGQHTPDLVLTSMVRTGGAELGRSVAELLLPAQVAGAQIAVIADNPAPARDELGTDVTIYRCLVDHPDDYASCSYRSGEGTGTAALRAAAEDLGVPFVDLSAWVCPPSQGPEPVCPPVIGRVLLFRQGSHLTATYVASLTPILHHELVRAGVARTPLDQIVWEVPGS